MSRLLLQDRPDETTGSGPRAREGVWTLTQRDGAPLCPRVWGSSVSAGTLHRRLHPFCFQFLGSELKCRKGGWGFSRGSAGML